MSNDKGYLLLVEDEPVVQSNNKKILQRRGYTIKQALTLAKAREIMSEELPKGIILDLQLPDGNGLDFLQELRKESGIPVLILTAMGNTEDIVRGFQLGSDDYLTKPYDLSVFLMRVEALLRRSSAIPDVLDYDAFKLYPATSRATLDGEDLSLTQKEYAIMQLLLQNTSRPLNAEYIYEKVWGFEMAEKDNSLKVAMAKLRKKLADFGYTVTASRGEGYYLEKIAIEG